MTAVANEDEGNLRWSHPENAPAWAARQPHVLEELSDDASWVASFLHNLTLARAGLLGEEDRPNFELAKLKFQEVSQRLHLDEDAFTLAVALADGARRIHPETRHFSIINDEILRLSEEQGATALIVLIAAWLAAFQHSVLHVLEPAGNS